MAEEWSAVGGGDGTFRKIVGDFLCPPPKPTHVSSKETGLTHRYSSMLTHRSALFC